MRDSLIVPPNRPLLFTYGTLSLAVVAITVIYPGLVTLPGAPWALLALVPILLVAAWGAWHALRQATAAEPVLVVSPQGLEVRGAGRQIPWSAVVEIESLGRRADRARVLRIVVDEPADEWEPALRYLTRVAWPPPWRRPRGVATLNDAWLAVDRAMLLGAIHHHAPQTLGPEARYLISAHG